MRDDGVAAVYVAFDLLETAWKQLFLVEIAAPVRAKATYCPVFQSFINGQRHVGRLQQCAADTTLSSSKVPTIFCRTRVIGGLGATSSVSDRLHAESPHVGRTGRRLCVDGNAQQVRSIPLGRAM